MKRILLLLAYCLSAPALAQGAALQSSQCSSAEVTIHKDFEGGRFAACKVVNAHTFKLTLEPENTPINPSPWYAFKLESNNPKPVDIVLQYSHGKHRYKPKVSTDKQNWQTIESNNIQLINDDKTQIRFSLPAASSLWVAAQPIMDNSDYLHFVEQFNQQPAEVNVSEYGKSVHGRPLYMLSSEAPQRAETLVILGRQHPPEVTGAIAMEYFVERLMADDPLARRFRNTINLLVFPNLNPDGVAAGNWRHNAAGIDLNRDWQAFEQPETRQTLKQIEGFLEGRQLRLVLDFHSTWKDLWYTPLPEQDPTNLATRWQQQLSANASPITFALKPGFNPKNPTAKTYFIENYQVPAITYELGDNTPIADIKVSSEIAATELMKLMLAESQ